MQEASQSTRKVNTMLYSCYQAFIIEQQNTANYFVILFENYLNQNKYWHSSSSFLNCRWVLQYAVVNQSNWKPNHIQSAPKLHPNTIVFDIHVLNNVYI